MHSQQIIELSQAGNPTVVKAEGIRTPGEPFRMLLAQAGGICRNKKVCPEPIKYSADCG